MEGDRGLSTSRFPFPSFSVPALSLRVSRLFAVFQLQNITQYCKMISYFSRFRTSAWESRFPTSTFSPPVVFPPPFFRVPAPQFSLVSVFVRRATKHNQGNNFILVQVRPFVCSVKHSKVRSNKLHQSTLTYLDLNIIGPFILVSFVTSLHVRPSSVEYSTFRPGSVVFTCSLPSIILQRKR